MLVEIREESADDIAAIRDVNKRAFGQDQEGNIVDALRSNGAALLSLVTTVDGQGRFRIGEIPSRVLNCDLMESVL